MAIPQPSEMKAPIEKIATKLESSPSCTQSQASATEIAAAPTATPQTPEITAPIHATVSSATGTGIANTTHDLLSLSLQPNSSNAETNYQKAAKAKAIAEAEAEAEHNRYISTLTIGQLCALAVRKVRADTLSHRPPEPRKVPYPHKACLWTSLASRYPGTFIADPFAADRVRGETVVEIDEPVSPRGSGERRFRVRHEAGLEEWRIGREVQKRESVLWDHFGGREGREGGREG